MKKVAIIYFSKTNTTANLAKAIAKGLDIYEIKIVNLCILGKDIIEGRYVINQRVLEQIAECEAIIFGTPTYMGNVSAQFKAFMDSTSELWVTQSWSGKLAAGFTCGSGPNGDQSNTLMTLVTFANQHGMLWIGLDTHFMIDNQLNRLGCQTGIVANAIDTKNNDIKVNKQDFMTAKYLGKRIGGMLNR